MKDFDETFSEYLETRETDELFGGFFEMVRQAYMAGYKEGMHQRSQGKVNPAIVMYPLNAAAEGKNIYPLRRKAESEH